MSVAAVRAMLVVAVLALRHSLAVLVCLLVELVDKVVAAARRKVVRVRLVASRLFVGRFWAVVVAPAILKSGRRRVLFACLLIASLVVAVLHVVAAVVVPAVEKFAGQALVYVYLVGI